MSAKEVETKAEIIGILEVNGIELKLQHISNMKAFNFIWWYIDYWLYDDN